MVKKENAFLVRDKTFYWSLFSMLLMVSLQNLVAYSVNMADNMMLGAYSQTALSGAATVNQIFFLVQQFAMTIGDSLVILSSQYWGQGRCGPIRKLTGTALKTGLVSGVAMLLVCQLFPHQILRIFTPDEAIIAQGTQYLSVISFTFVLFIFTNTLMAALRSVEVTKISFGISAISLVINVGINYTLIFGKFGFPEMGIRGAAVGTLVARIVELGIVLGYLLWFDKKLHLFSENFFQTNRTLRADYIKVAIPVVASGVLWAISVPMQTAILGHLPGDAFASADAIAANSVATTFYQYMKVVVVAMSSVSTVMIGKAIGQGDMQHVKASARSLVVIDVAIGLILASILFALRLPLLSNYKLSERAFLWADQLILVMCVVMIGMAYQMPVSMGILRGAGDVKFALAQNMISTWLIVMPLSLLSAFVWKLPIPVVVAVIQSDQVFKCIPTAIRLHGGKWVQTLTSPNS